MNDGKMLIDVGLFMELVTAQAKLNAILDYIEYNSRLSESSVILAIAGEPFRAEEKDRIREESWKKLVEEEERDEGTESEAYQN